MAGALRFWAVPSFRRIPDIVERTPFELVGLGRSWASELLDRELFTSLTEARFLLQNYRVDHNEHRPHSSLRQRAPAAFHAAWGGQGGRKARPRRGPFQRLDRRE